MISDDMPPPKKIVNMLIPILMHFCGLVSNWSVASRIKVYVIKQNVTFIMTSNYFRQYIAVTNFYPIKRHVTKASALEY